PLRRAHGRQPRAAVGRPGALHRHQPRHRLHLLDAREKPDAGDADDALLLPALDAAVGLHVPLPRHARLGPGARRGAAAHALPADRARHHAEGQRPGGGRPPGLAPRRHPASRFRAGAQALPPHPRLGKLEKPFDTIRGLSPHAPCAFRRIIGRFRPHPMNIEQARFNMVEQQIRPWEVLDPRVLELLFEVKREDFVPPEHRALAFADLEIPLGHGESMMAPKLEARLLQELDVQPGDAVYEVGTGSGYLTALLARRARHVTSVEIYADLRERAARNLAAAGIANVTLLDGDGARELLAPGPFDVIVLTGSTPILPQAFPDGL